MLCPQANTFNHRAGHGRTPRSWSDLMNPKRQRLKDGRRARKLADEAWESAKLTAVRTNHRPKNHTKIA
jgi:hypothetical protein